MDDPIIKSGAWIMVSQEVLDDWVAFDPFAPPPPQPEPLPPMGVRSLVNAYIRKYRLKLGFAILPDDWRDWDDDD